MDTATAGFFLGFSLILAIGAQNAFVLRQGLRRSHVLPVALTCALSDAVLIVAGVAGFGALVDRFPSLITVLTWGGAAFLLAYGALAFRAAWRGGAQMQAADDAPQRLGPVLATCLALTWLNPHVYLDTVVLLGGIAARYGSERWMFGAGAALASLTFFLSLAYGARLLAPVFARPRAWQALDLLVGLVMWGIAAKLLWMA